MERGLQGRETVVLQHVEESLIAGTLSHRPSLQLCALVPYRLASIVQSKEEDFGVLVQKAWEILINCREAESAVECKTHRAEQERPRTS